MRRLSALFNRLLKLTDLELWHENWLKHRIPTGTHVIHKRSAFILPTRQGVILTLFLIAMLIACINYNLSLGYFLTFFVFSVALGSMTRTHQNLVNLEIDVQLNTSDSAIFFVSSHLQVNIRMKNLSSQAKYAIQIQPRATQKTRHFPVFSPASAITFGLLEKHVAQQTITFQARNRGKHQVPAFTVSTLYPLGLWRAWSYHLNNLEVLVCPAPAATLPKLVSLQNAYWLAPQQLSTVNQMAQGDAVSHIEIKETINLKNIYWPGFAKGLLAERILDSQAESPVEFLISIENCLEYELEAQLSEICAGVMYCYKNRIACVLNLGIQIVPSTGIASSTESHFHKCFEALALHGLNDAD